MSVDGEIADGKALVDKKSVYKVDVYMPRTIVEHLEKYFDNIKRDLIPVAEEALCGFENFWKTYSEENREKILKYVKQETLKRSSDSEKSSNIVSIFHSNEFYN